MTERRWLCAAALIAAMLLGCGRDTPESLIAKGRAAIENKDADSALVHLKAALQSAPESAEGRYLLGRVLLSRGDARGAAVELTKAADQKYPPELVLPELARALLESGQARKLITQYSATDLADKPAQAALKSSVGVAWRSLGDPVKAEAAFEAALAAVPNYPRVVVLQARQVAGKGDFDTALQMAEGVLARDNAQREAWQLKGELLLHARQDAKGAEECFRKALSLDRTFVNAYAALFQIRMRAGDLAGAKAQAEELRQVLPKHPQTMLVDGHLAFVEKDYKSAREKAQLLLRLAPDHPNTLMLSALVESRAGSPLIAQTQLSKIVQLDPRNAMARRELARVSLRLGQPARALEVLQPIVETGSTDAEANGLAGIALAQLGDAEASERSLAVAAKLQPESPQRRTALALARLGRGELDTGFAELEQLSASSRDNAAAMALVGARMTRGQFDQALAAVDAWIVRSPQDAMAHLMRGRVQVARKDPAAARASFEKALEVDPSMFAATLGLASIDVADKKFEPARQRLEGAVSKHPENFSARLSLAELLERSGAPMEDTRKVLREAVTAAPNEPSVRLALIDFLLRKRQATEALEQAQAAVAALPNNLDVLFALGRAQERKGDLQQALGTYRRITGIEPNRALAHVRIAAVQKAQGNRPGAIAALRRALEADADFVPARIALIDMLATDRQSKEAIDVAREMQRRMPAQRGGYMLEGAIHDKAKNYEAAAKAYGLGLQRAPNDSALALQLYRAFVDGGRRTDAARVAKDWLDNHPEDAAMLYLAATGAILRADYDTAESQLRRVLDLKPNQAMAMNDLAWVLLERGRPGALPLAKKAVELTPGNAAMLDTLALAQASERDFTTATQTQKQAIEIAPGNMDLRLTLARIAIQGGDTSLARAELDRLTSLGTRYARHAEVAKLRKSL